MDYGVFLQRANSDHRATPTNTCVTRTLYQGPNIPTTNHQIHFLQNYTPNSCAKVQLQSFKNYVGSQVPE